MPDLVSAIVAAPSWNTRVNLVRQIPEQYGRAQLRDVYSRLAQELYAPDPALELAYVVWRQDYELASITEAYEQAYSETQGFSEVDADGLFRCLMARPASLRIFRLLLALTIDEFSLATRPVAMDFGVKIVGSGRIKSMESGRAGTEQAATVLAETIVRGVDGTLFPAPPPQTRSRQDRPDLAEGWATVRRYAENGVPLDLFLHQRHYGGAFIQLLNSTGKERGDALEEAVREVLDDGGIPHIQTGGSNQAEIRERFNITVQPAPDFVFYDASDSLRGMLECKLANNGGTARDKAARFRSLRQESERLGGVPVFAYLGGLGWRRTGDALGPVVEACDGRVFTLGTLPEMLTVDPLPAIAAQSS